MVSFDPYLNWLGIPPHEQPPNFYRLLGVVLFESNPEVIEQAADRQSLHVGGFQAGPQGEMCQQLLSEIAMARFCLLDPQQKAAYDGQLQGGLAQRGECVVAPPPPAWSGGDQPYQGSPPQFAPQAAQFGSPAPQFGPQAPSFGPPGGMGPSNPGQAGHGPMQGPMGMPGPPSPMQLPIPGGAGMPGMAGLSPPPEMPGMPPGMSGPPQPPGMQMPSPTMMSGPPGFAPAMPRPSAPAAMPVAAPFPTATAVAARPAPSPAAPPALPPAAPQRPIDELESLTAQPTTRRRFLKRKKEDYTKQIIFGGVIVVAGILFFIAYAAVTSGRNAKSGFWGIGDAVEKPPEKIGSKIADDLAKKKKSIEKDKEKEKEEKEKKAAARASASGGAVSPLRPMGEARRPNPRGPASDDGDGAVATPHTFGAPTRSMDDPGPGGGVPAGQPAQGGQPGRQPNGDVAPQDVGTENDPVMGPPP